MLYKLTVDELKVVILVVWENYYQSTIDNLINCFFQRLHLAIQSDGDTIQPTLRKRLNSLQNVHTLMMKKGLFLIY